MPPVASTGPGVSRTRSCAYVPDDAYEIDESTTASVPATAHQPPGRSIPVSAATPTSPRATPTHRIGGTCSCGR